MNREEFDKNMRKLYPFSLAPFEYNGYLTKGALRIKTVAVGLGLNNNVVSQAIKRKADVLLVHNAPESLNDGGDYARMRRIAIDRGLSIYRLHLPLDFASGGLIDVLCDLLGFTGSPARLSYQGSSIIGGVYTIEANLSFIEVLKRIKRIHPRTIRIAGARKSFYRGIGITTGDGCKPEFLLQLRPDAFICGLLNQESERIAKDLGITIIEATSYATENEPLKCISNNIVCVFPSVRISFIDLKDSIANILVAKGGE